MMANQNKDAAVSFLKMVSSGNVREAYTKFVGPGFKHHNPYFEGSAETLISAMEENARENPNKTLDVKLAIAEGDLVAVHSHVRQRPDDETASIHSFDLKVASWNFGILGSQCGQSQTSMECSK
jgi:predicted SnoaL-like aldol condensation-catalyzing enzyme